MIFTNIILLTKEENESLTLFYLVLFESLSKVQGLKVLERNKTKMKRKILLAIIMVFTLALCFSLVSCGEDSEAVKSIEYVKDSTATEYTVGATPDFSGLKVKVTYEDDHTETIGADKLDIGTIDTSTAGEKTLTVKYGDFSVELKITVKAPPATVTGIQIVAGSADTSVKLGAVYNTSNIQVEAIYSDGTKKLLDNDDLQITAPVTSAVGESTLKVKYQSFEASLTVTVTGVTGMQVVANSIANEIYVGDALDTSSLTVIVTYSSGEKKTVEREHLIIGNVDTSTVGDKSLAIVYDGFTYQYTVKVYGPSEITLNTAGVKTKVFVGETLNLSGLSALVKFSNNTSKTVPFSELNITSVSTAAPGEQTVKVSYDGLVTADLPITVVGVKNMTISGVDKDILVGQTLDTSALTLSVTYTDNTTAVVNDGFSVGSFDSTSKGTKKLTVTYLDGSAEYSVTVHGISSLSVKGVESKVNVGEAHNLSGLTAELVYENGEKVSVAANELSIANVDVNTVGTQTFKVEYTDEHEGKFTYTLDVTVVGVTEIAITGGYAQYVKAGAAIATADVKIKVTYSDGTVKNTVTPTSVSADNSTGVITATYTERGITKNATANVTVCNPVGIKVSGVPTYISATNDINEVKAALANMKVYLYYTAESGLTDDLLSEGYETNVDSLDFSSEEEGYSQTLEVTYQDYDKEEIIISTSEPVLEDIRIDGFNRLLAINKDYNYSSVIVKAIYANGREDNIAFAELTIGEVDSTVAGEQTITVSYSGKEESFTVKVLPVASIVYVDGIVDKININEDLDVSAVTVKVIYSDGTEDKLEETVTTSVTTSFDKTKGGDQTVTLTYLGKSDTTLVHVKAVSSATVKEGTFDAYIKDGAAVDTSRVTLTVTYTDGTVKESAIPTSVTANNATGVITATYTENGETVTATAAVKILPLHSITASGLDETVEIGADLDVSNLKLTLTYTDGIDTVTDIISAGMEVISGFNKNTYGNQTLTVTYEGKTCEVKIHVRAITEIEIIEGTYKDHIREGYRLDTSSIEVKVTYSDGTTDTGAVSKFGASINAVQDSSTKAETVTVSIVSGQNTLTDTVTVSKIVEIYSVDALNGTIPAVMFEGDKLPLDKIALTVTYKTGEEHVRDENDEPMYDSEHNPIMRDILVSYLVFIDDPRLTVIGSGDNDDNEENDDYDAENGTWKTTGEKMLTLIFDKDTTVTDPDSSIVSYKWFAVARIFIRGVSSIELVEGSMPTTVFQNEDLNSKVATAQFMITYSDGSYTYVNTSYDLLKLVIPENATANVGEVVIKVSYRNSAEFEIPVNVVGDSSLNSAMIFGVELPSAITARDSYKKNFKNQDNLYVVGDDNPFIFRLVLLALDPETRKPVSNQSYESVSSVYLLNESLEVVGEAVGSDMVIINDAKGNNSFDFTDAAIGKTFKIVTAPKDADNKTKELLVKVVDGYNIYDAKELNYITNFEEDLDGGDYAFYKDENGNEYGQLTAVKNFLASKGMEYKNINSAVLHGNINVTEKDLPPEYFFTYEKNGVEKKGLLDYFSVYNRNFNNANGESFTLYGNYYSVYSYNLPCVVEKGYANNTDDFSNSQLFHFRGRNSNAMTNPETKHKIFTADVVDTGFRDNDPNSNDQSASARHMLGLAGLKFRKCVGTVRNVNVEAFYISLFADWDNLDLNIIDSNIYNAWQGHLFIFNENDMGASDTMPVDYYQNIKVNIENSLMAKCGGPVILSQQRDGYDPLNTDPTKNLHNIYSGADVTVDDKSVLYSYVTGQEAWFVAVGATAQAANIMMLDASLSEASDGKATFTSTEKIQGVSTMNLVMVSMNSGFSADGLYTTINDSFTISGNKELELGENIGAGLSNSELDMLYSQLGNSAFSSPIFQTSNPLPIDPRVIDVLAQSDDAEIKALAAMLEHFNSTFVLNPFAAKDERINDVGVTIEQMLNSNEVLKNALSHYGMDTAYTHDKTLYQQGNYISLYYTGLAVVLEYYHAEVNQ